MIEYKPDPRCEEVLKHFPETWAIVSSPEACLLMRESSNAGRPAVDRFHELPSFRRLDSLVRNEALDDMYDEFHQVTGRLCRQVMEQLGYELFKEDVPTLHDYIFKKGTVYRRIIC